MKKPLSFSFFFFYSTNKARTHSLNTTVTGFPRTLHMAFLRKALATSLNQRQTVFFLMQSCLLSENSMLFLSVKVNSFSASLDTAGRVQSTHSFSPSLADPKWAANATIWL